MRRKVVFILASLSDSHFKNRIVEFMDHQIDVDVYGFERTSHKTPKELPYHFEVLGMLHNESYINRVKLYLKCFRLLGKNYNGQKVVFYLCGLDIAMFFHFINPSFDYIYEECDLVHTYLGKAKYVLEWIDEKIIKKSLLTITTSEGFIKYHFGNKRPQNVLLIENKLNPAVRECSLKDKRPFSLDSLSIGFVGAPRFDSVYNFIDVFCKICPNQTFHVYGGPIIQQFEPLKKYKNCVFHGFFKNPTDLPDIYANIDLVVATYDTRFENVRYAEPNKIYEAIYFETPIVVSSGTFLAEKVKRLGIGYDIDALNNEDVINFINKLTEESIRDKISNIQKIDKNETLNINNAFFERLDLLIKE